MGNKPIPFNKPFIIGNELAYIEESVKSGHIAGDGLFTAKCHTLLQAKLHAKKVMLTTSGTAALEMAAILCNIGPGDEVIMPSFTFVSTANAFYLRGARPVFVDIRPDTLNIDETRIAEAVTERTKAIVPVHYAGVACEMDSILAIARDGGILVVEDSAQAINSKYKGRYLGTIGDIGALSFHETKNVICGEGGAILINNDDFIERAEIVREKGTDRSKFFRGEVDKYTWTDIGSSYLPSDLLAAYLFAQLEEMDHIDSSRKNIFNIYYSALAGLADKGCLELPAVLPKCDSNSHMFQIILSDEETRDALIDYLKKEDIYTVFHYLPLHLSSVGLSLGYNPGDFPVTESVSRRLLRLPFYYGLTEEDQERVVKSIERFFL